MSAVAIHTVPGSPYARSVAATFEEKGAPWRVIRIVQGENRRHPHLALHPFGKMPVLEHADFVLYETQAILRYLDRLLPEPPLTPADPRRAARMDQVLNINDAYVFPGCANVIVFHRIIGPRALGVPTDEAAIRAAMPNAQVVFGELSRLLDDADFFGGPALSLADLALAPQLDFFAATPEWAALTDGRDNLVEWLTRMNARPSMQATTWPRVSAMAEAA